MGPDAQIDADVVKRAVYVESDGGIPARPSANVDQLRGEVSALVQIIGLSERQGVLFGELVVGSEDEEAVVRVVDVSPSGKVGQTRLSFNGDGQSTGTQLAPIHIKNAVIDEDGRVAQPILKIGGDKAGGNALFGPGRDEVTVCAIRPLAVLECRTKALETIFTVEGIEVGRHGLALARVGIEPGLDVKRDPIDGAAVADLAALGLEALAQPQNDAAEVVDVLNAGIERSHLARGDVRMGVEGGEVGLDDVTQAMEVEESRLHVVENSAEHRIAAHAIGAVYTRLAAAALAIR